MSDFADFLDFPAQEAHRVPDWFRGWLARAELDNDRISVSNRATKCQYGLMDTGAHAVNRNFHVQTVTETGFDAVRIGLFNCHTADTTGVKAAIGVAPTLGAPGAAENYTPTVWVDCTWSGSGTVTLPLGTATRPTLTFSDEMPLESLPRTDGGAFPVLHTRVHVPSGNATASKLSPGGLFAWLRDESLCGGRVWRAMLQDGGDFVATKGSFNSAVDATRWYPMVIQYLARGKIISVALVGDSIISGIGASAYTKGQFWLARELRSSFDRPIELANFGWAGSQTGAYYLRMLDLITAGAIGPGHLAVLGAFSPNDYTTAVTAAGITTSKLALALCQRAAYAARAGFAAVNGAPVNPATKNWDATDSLRRNFNQLLSEYNLAGVLDQSSILSGLTDSDGQVNFNELYTTDNLHPNDAGIAALVPATVDFLRRAGA